MSWFEKAIGIVFPSAEQLRRRADAVQTRSKQKHQEKLEAEKIELEKGRREYEKKSNETLDKYYRKILSELPKKLHDAASHGQYFVSFTEVPECMVYENNAEKYPEIILEKSKKTKSFGELESVCKKNNYSLKFIVRHRPGQRSLDSWLPEYRYVDIQISFSPKI